MGAKRRGGTLVVSGRFAFAQGIQTVRRVVDERTLERDVVLVDDGVDTTGVDVFVAVAGVAGRALVGSDQGEVDDGRTLLPSEFDPRTKWPVRASLIDDPIDQGECGSCWAVAPAKVMSDRLCIATNGRVSTHLSGLQLLAALRRAGDGFRPSSDIDGCGGGFPMNAYENAKVNGLVSGAQFGDRQTCMPYSFKPCHHPCKHGEGGQVSGTRAFEQSAPTLPSIFRVDSLVSCRDGDFDCMALEIFNNGPVSSFVGTVFDEFYKVPIRRLQFIEGCEYSRLIARRTRHGGDRMGYHGKRRALLEGV